MYQFSKDLSFNSISVIYTNCLTEDCSYVEKAVDYGAKKIRTQHSGLHAQYSLVRSVPCTPANQMASTAADHLFGRIESSTCFSPLPMIGIDTILTWTTLFSRGILSSTWIYEQLVSEIWKSIHIQWSFYGLTTKHLWLFITHKNTNFMLFYCFLLQCYTSLQSCTIEVHIQIIYQTPVIEVNGK